MKWSTKFVWDLYYVAYTLQSKLFGRGSLIPLEFLSLQYKYCPPRDGCEYEEYVLRRMEHEKESLRQVLFLPWQVDFIYAMIIYHSILNSLLLIFNLVLVVKPLLIEHRCLITIIYVGSFVSLIALIRFCLYANGKSAFDEYLESYYTGGVEYHIRCRNKSLIVLTILLAICIGSTALLIVR